MKTTITALVGLVLIVEPASAVIIVSGTGTSGLDTTSLSGSFTYNLQGGGNALVMGTYIDAATPTASNVLFDGVAPNGFIQTGRGFLAYYYNPDASVNISFNVAQGSTAANGGYYLYELSNVDTSVLADLSSTTGSITTTTDNRFIVDFAGNNNGATLAPVVGSKITSFTATNFNGGGGGGALGSGTGLAGPAGAQMLGWTGSGNGITGELSAAFVAAVGGPVAWNVNGGGNWGTGTNWVGNSPPGSGGEALLGDVLTAANAPANITLNVPVNAGKITISNANRYNITGPQALTLSGSAEVLTGSGTHGISAVIAGSAGLTKSGGGSLVLSANNTYTGTTQVVGGSLQLANTGAVDGAVSVAAASELRFVAGFNGTFGGVISGNGNLALDGSLTTETVTLSGANSLGGQILISGGTLAVSSPSGLGAGDGTTVTQTRVNEFGGLGTGKLALSGNINIANELLILGPRRGEGIVDRVHLTSAGNNTWGGNVKGDANGDNYNFESTSGTLTLTGTISAPDNDGGVRNFVFSGAGNFNVSDITDFSTNPNGVVDVASTNLQTNVFVYKRGAGTLTISTATNQQNDFWQGGTFIEGGTVEVLSNGSNQGELWGPIEIQSGATLDVDHFVTYSMPAANQSLSGGGTIQATGTTVKFFADNSLSPGDTVGTLTIDGNAQLSDEFSTQGGVLTYELGNNPATIGGTENDLIQVNGSLSTIGSPDMTVRVIAAEGLVSTGQYRLISHTGGAVDVSGMIAQFSDELGNPLTARQTLAVSSASGQVNLDVTGSAANLTWTGANGTAWDKNTTANWDDSGSEVFFDQDQVTFDDSAVPSPSGDFNGDDTVDAADYVVWRKNETANNPLPNDGGATDQAARFNLWRANFGETGATGPTVVNIAGGNVYPSLATFDSATGNTYSITGPNGFGGTTPINLTGNVRVVLNNTNTLQGNINIGANATLDLGTGGGANTVSGNISGPGTLVVGGGFNPFTTANSLTGPIIVNGGSMVPNNAGAFGTTDSGTTVNTGGNVLFNFVNLLVSEAFTFNGGTLTIAGNDGSATTLTGAINVAAGGATFQTGGNLGADALIINNNISGSASGPVNVNVAAGSTVSITGNVSNNGVLTKTGGGILALGATTTVAAPEIRVNGGTLNVTAQGALTLSSGQTLSGADGTVQGSVTAPSGSTIRVGQAGMPQRILAQYIDATWNPGNTTHIGGGALTPPNGTSGGEDQWSARPGFGNNANLLQGAPVGPYPDTASVPLIQTSVTGLLPNTTYDVYANFWDVAGAAWRILAGPNQGTLTLYANPGDNLAGATAAINTSTLEYSTPVLKVEGDRTLFAALIGQLTTDGSGNLPPVFIDDNGNGPNERTWYDGITVSGGVTSAVGETLTINGDLSLQAGSVLALDLGTPAETDLLAITGSLVAGGTLNVTLDVTVPAPALGNVFNLLDFASASGAFATMNLPSLSPELAWNTSNLLTNGQLSVVASGSGAGSVQGTNVPEPASVILLGSAAVGFGICIRRSSRVRSRIYHTGSC
jgi:autotransporter-associated beta strand protein